MIAEIAWIQKRQTKLLRQINYLLQPKMQCARWQHAEKKREHIFVCFSLLQRQTKLTNSDVFVKARNKEECRHERLK